MASMISRNGLATAQTDLIWLSEPGSVIVFVPPTHTGMGACKPDNPRGIHSIAPPMTTTTTVCVCVAVAANPAWIYGVSSVGGIFTMRQHARKVLHTNNCRSGAADDGDDNDGGWILCVCVWKTYVDLPYDRVARVYFYTSSD